MLIDEDRIHVLTKYAGTKGSKKKVLSDHNILYCRFSILYDQLNQQIRKEFFNLKSTEGRRAFLEYNSNSEKLSKCFLQNRTFPHNSNIFFHELKSCLHQSFKKVRIRHGGMAGKSDEKNKIQEQIRLKIQLKIFLKNCNCDTEKKIAEDKLNEVERFLIDNCAAKNAETVKGYISDTQNEEGNFSQLKLWKLKQKLCPKVPDPPMAKRDENGTLLTAPELLKDLYLRTYKNRLRNRDMKKELMDVFFLKEELWLSRLEELKVKKTSAWTRQELRKALKSLKNNKTADPNGMTNELFKED